MSAFIHVLKTLFVPAVVSLLIYLVLTYALLPFIRRHRHRYNQYMPMPMPASLDGLSTRTSSLRSRMTDAVVSLFLPSTWAWRRRRVVDADGEEHNDEELFDDLEGESMVGFDIDERRREALEQRRSMMADDQRRLSRDLEEGFRDDSDDEPEDDRRRSLSRSRGSSGYL